MEGCYVERFLILSKPRYSVFYWNAPMECKFSLFFVAPKSLNNKSNIMKGFDG
jgi:hypothetical protein